MRALRFTLAVLTVAFGLSILVTTLATAGSHRPQMRRVTNAQAIRTPTPAHTPAVEVGESVRLQGTLRLTGGRLFLGRTVIDVGANTGSSLRDGILDPRRLHGKRVTVFGTRVHGNRVRADLVMAHESGFTFTTPQPDPTETPSPADPRVGTVDRAGGS